MIIYNVRLQATVGQAHGQTARGPGCQWQRFHGTLVQFRPPPDSVHDHAMEFLQFVESADALIEGFRPGVTERLGLGPGRLPATNPHFFVSHWPCSTVPMPLGR